MRLPVSPTKLFLLALTPLALLISALFATPARAQGKQAIVLTKPAAANAPAPECDGETEVNYLVVFDLKLNNKDEVRLLGGGPASSDAVTVSRDRYEDSTKVKLRDLSLLRWGRDGVFYGMGAGSQSPVAALPQEMKPQKTFDPPLNSFYGTTLTGEVRDGKQKRRVTLQLREVWKVYFVAEGVAPNDTLFRHASEEKSVALWEAYLRKTSNYRQAEANASMRDALISCSRADLTRFEGGDYGALDRARRKSERAQSVRADDQTAQLSQSIKQAQEKVDRARGVVRELVSANRYDEAITAAEPIKIYLDTWPDLKEMYTDTLQKSHEQHLFKGRQAFEARQLETSRDECTTAWQRVPASAEARACVCTARSEIAFRDQGAFRQRKQPKNAKETIERQLADADCTRDPRLVASLREANCEYAQQLLAESRTLVAVGGGGAPPARPAASARVGASGRRGAANRRAGGAAPAAGTNGSSAATPATTVAPVLLKAIMAQNKKDFREARVRLLLAAQLCPDETVRATLEAVNRRLAEFCLAEAQKALQRGDDGTAYVYLMTAQGYTPGDPSVSGQLATARERFQDKTRVHLGVVLGARAGGRDGEQLVSEIASEIESAANASGAERPLVLDRAQAAASLQAIQAGRPLNAPTVIFAGDLVSGNVNRTDSPRQVRSSFSYENPYWKDADRVHDARNEDLKRCRKQPGADCSGIEADVLRLRASRDRHERNVTEYYYFRENQIRVTGDLRLSFRATDSVSRSTREADVLSAAVNRECVERSGTRREDYNARDATCDIGDEFSYMRQMLDEVKRDAQRRAINQLSALPLSYYERARRAAARPSAVEDYLRFLFLTRDKEAAEAQEARRYLAAFDPELETDGVMR